MSVRVYVPLTSSGLAALVAEGRLDGPLRAHAVTDTLRQVWAGADDEELEYAALVAAGDASWAARGPGDRPRRHVVAADVPAVADVGDPGDPSAVDVAADVPWKRIASAHVDTDDQPEGETPDDDLAWFATQEVAGLVGEP